MSEISVWSVVPAKNGTLGSPPIYWPEGQAPSTVNNCARQMMSSIRIQWQDAQWFNWGYTVTRISGTKFDMNIGTNSATTSVVANFVPNRRIKLYDTTTMYATISEASLSGSLINITVTPDSGSLTNSFSSAYLSILTPTNTSIPSTVTTAGGLRSFQIFTSGSGATYTKPAGITSILVECIGGGGGGGSSTCSSTQLGAGGGGGGGGYCRKFFLTAAATYTYTVGAGGAATVAGSDTTFSTMTAGGGAGAVANTGGAAGSLGGLGGTGGTCTGGDINQPGGAGALGVAIAGISAVGGNGGSSALGGGAADSSEAAGIAAMANSGGGGGGAGNNAANTTNAGGAGGSGLIIVWEFS